MEPPNATHPPAVPDLDGHTRELAGAVVPATLLALAALHAAWALGWRRPGGSDRGLAEHVLSRAERERLLELTGEELPPTSVVWAVGAGLATAAWCVRAAADGTTSRTVRAATWAVCGVLLGRGVQGVVVSGTADARERYEVLDLAVYAPLSLALGGATGAIARRARPARHRSPLPRRPRPRSHA